MRHGGILTVIHGQIQNARLIKNFIQESLNVTGSAVPLSMLPSQQVLFNLSAHKIYCIVGGLL